MRTGRELIIASWGIAGVIALVGRALVSLTPIALEPIRAGQLGSWHWVILVTWVALSRELRDGVERYLIDALEPQVAMDNPEAAPIPVNLPI